MRFTFIFLFLFAQIAEFVFAQTATDVGTSLIESAAGHVATDYAHKAIDSAPAAMTRVIPAGVWKTAASEILGGKLNPVMFGFTTGMKVTSIGTSSDRTMGCKAKMTPKGAVEFWSLNETDRATAIKACSFSEQFDIGFEKYMNDSKNNQIKKLREELHANCEEGYKKEFSTLEYENKETPGKVQAAYKNHSVHMKVHLAPDGTVQNIFATIIDNDSNKETARFFVGPDGIVTRKKVETKSKVIFPQSPSIQAMDTEFFKQMLEIEMVRIKMASNDLKKKLCSDQPANTQRRSPASSQNNSK